MNNFYPAQYSSDKKFSINHNYLSDQFGQRFYFRKSQRFIGANDHLGSTVDEVEELIAAEAETKFAVGTRKGTDVFLSSKRLV